MPSDILLVDAVAALMVDFAEPNTFLYVAMVCRPWLHAWGDRPRKTNTMTASSSASQLEEAIGSDVPLFGLCRRSVSVGRTDLIPRVRAAGAPWIDTMAIAATLNDLSVIKALWWMGCPMVENAFEVASFKGNLGMMTFLMQKGCPSGQSMRCAAAAKNKTSLVWLKENGCPLDAGAFAQACLSGNVDMISWFVTNDCGWDELATASAVRSNNMAAVEYLVSHGFRLNERATQAAAALETSEMLRWLRLNGCPWGYTTCCQASADGRLVNLRFARENGCVWGPAVCAAAAKNGHLSTLKWARENGCPWEGTTVLAAATGGHIGVLDWCLARLDCPYVPDRLVCASAARTSQFETLVWLREKNKFEWDSNSLACGAETGSFDIVEYCLAEGVRWIFRWLSLRPVPTSIRC